MKYLTLVVSLLASGQPVVCAATKAKTGTKPAHKAAKASPRVTKGPKKARISQPVTSPPVVPEPVDDADVAIEPPMRPVADTKSSPEIYEATAMLEQMPEFKGGTPGLMRYLSSNLQYPTQASRTISRGRWSLASRFVKMAGFAMKR